MAIYSKSQSELDNMRWEEQIYFQSIRATPSNFDIRMSMRSESAFENLSQLVPSNENLFEQITPTDRKS
jgi:hypothetical protein